MKADHLYVVAWRPAGPTKIGIATNVVDRLSQLQGGNPNRLRIYAAWRVVGHHAVGVEQELLRRLDAHRMTGEWLRMPPKYVSAAASGLARETGITLVRWRPTEQELEMRERQNKREQNRRMQKAVELYKWLIKP